jgi:hypothetical protein
VSTLPRRSRRALGLRTDCRAEAPRDRSQIRLRSSRRDRRKWRFLPSTPRSLWRADRVCAPHALLLDQNLTSGFRLRKRQLMLPLCRMNYGRYWARTSDPQLVDSRPPLAPRIPSPSSPRSSTRRGPGRRLRRFRARPRRRADRRVELTSPPCAGGRALSYPITTGSDAWRSSESQRDHTITFGMSLSERHTESRRVGAPLARHDVGPMRGSRSSNHLPERIPS